MSNDNQQKVIAAFSNASMHNKISVNEVIQKTGLSSEIVIKTLNFLADRQQIQACPLQMLRRMLDGMSLDKINMPILYR